MEVSGLCHKIRGSLVEPQSHASYRDARAACEDGNSGDRDTISDGCAATSRGSHRGDGGIADIAEFAMEDVIGIYAPTLDLFSVGGYVKIGRATLWRYKYVAPRVEGRVDVLDSRRVTIHA